MIQRKQSFYLLVAILLIVASYFLPFGVLIHDGQELAIRSYGLKDSSGNYAGEVSSYWFHIPLTLVVFLDIIAIRQFRLRTRQLSLVRITFILFAISFVLLSMYISEAGASHAPHQLRPGVSLLLIFASLALNWLAARAIRKDEELVRSVDRIR